MRKPPALSRLAASRAVRIDGVESTSANVPPTALAVWQTANSIGTTVAEVLSTPPILTAMLAASLLSAGGLRLLHGLRAIDRRRDDARA